MKEKNIVVLLLGFSSPNLATVLLSPLVVDSFQGLRKLDRRVTLYCEDIVLFITLIVWEHAFLSLSKLNKLNKQEPWVQNSYTTYGLHISKTSSWPIFFITVSQKNCVS